MRVVIVLPRAQRQFRKALDWWERNRDKAPMALLDDFIETRELIAETPSIGKVYRGRGPGVRRVLMERVRYYVYYRLNADDDVEIIAIWHASRRPPRL